MKTLLARTAVCVSTMVVSAAAAADDKAVCLDAASRAQTLRDQHKLVSAREALLVCGHQRCPTVVQHDCAAWLAEVEKSLPTIVISAKDESGADLVDVTVTVDNIPFAKKLDGSSLPVDPGPHAFHFQIADGTSLDRQVLIKQGEKDQSVAIVLKRTPAPVTLPGPPPAAASGPSGDGAAQAGESASLSSKGEASAVWRTVGWTSGGLGVFGLVLGGVFGGLATSAKGHSCDANKVCQPGTIDDIKAKALVSDVGFIGGGVLLAAGVTAILLSPSPHREAAPRARIIPVVESGGTFGAVVGGSW